MKTEVQDVITEGGIKLNNILLSVLITSVLTVGGYLSITVDEIKDNINVIVTGQAVIIERISNNTKYIENNDKRITVLENH